MATEEIDIRKALVHMLNTLFDQEKREIIDKGEPVEITLLIGAGYEFTFGARKLEQGEGIEITKHPRHDHFWIEDGILCESYTTIRGMRYRELGRVDASNTDNISLDDLKEMQKKLTILNDDDAILPSNN